jgi:hypothetical protein
VTAERAAEDLAAYRAQKAADLKELEQQAVRDAVDGLRQAEPQQPFEQPPTNAYVRAQLAQAIDGLDQTIPEPI